MGEGGILGLHIFNLWVYKKTPWWHQLDDQDQTHSQKEHSEGTPFIHLECRLSFWVANFKYFPWIYWITRYMGLDMDTFQVTWDPIISRNTVKNISLQCVAVSLKSGVISWWIIKIKGWVSQHKSKTSDSQLKTYTYHPASAKKLNITDQSPNNSSQLDWLTAWAIIFIVRGKGGVFVDYFVAKIVEVMTKMMRIVKMVEMMEKMEMM